MPVNMAMTIRCKCYLRIAQKGNKNTYIAVSDRLSIRIGMTKLYIKYHKEIVVTPECSFTLTFSKHVSKRSSVAEHSRFRECMYGNIIDRDFVYNL